MADATNQTGPTIDRGTAAPISNPNASFNPTGAESATTPTSRFDSGIYVEQKYNEILHNVDLYLENSGNFDVQQNPKRYYINPAAVLGMQISDTVNDWVVDGSMTFMYLPEPAPPISKTTGGQSKQTNIKGIEQAAFENGKTLNTYQFRGDGFDLLRVMIMPKATPKNGYAKNAIQIDQKDTKWMLSYLFSIYDIEDVNDVPELKGFSAAYMKCLKLKFHDVRYQMLRTTNLEYSTAIPKDPSFVPNLNSEIAINQGVLHTGDALKDILNEALAKPENGGCEEFKIPLDFLDWNKGKSELFYTSPAQYSAADDIQYVYSHHVADKQLKGSDVNVNDMCLLHTNRADEFGKLEPIALTPISDFFEKAGSSQSNPGELQKEHFFVTSFTNEQETADRVYRAPLGGNNKNVDVKTDKYGQIISYSFVDMSPSVNSNMFCTTPVYSVDIGKRKFNIQFTGNDVSSARNVISKSYISNLYKKGSDEEKLFLPTIHKTKKDLNIFPTFSLNGNNAIVRQKNGLHNLIYTGLFQNACICFKTIGLTLRESGTFIGIDKAQGCVNNDYNNKLYGQWFVVKVDHLFETGIYMNVIYAVKLHRYDELKETFSTTIDGQ